MPVYKDEKRNSWFCTFYYRDWQGNNVKKKKEGFKLKREAQDYERDFIKQQSGSCDMLFKDMVTLYLQDKKVKLKPTTYINKEFLIKNKLLPIFGDKAVNEITANDVRMWHNSLLKDNDYKPTYLRKLNTQLSAIMGFAVKYYSLSQNPVTLCEGIGKGRANAMQFWTVDQYKQFRGTIQDNKSLLLSFDILFWTGMRCGELTALTWNDINFTQKKISINKTHSRINGQDIITTTKTDKSTRIVDIPPFLCDSIQEYYNSLYDKSNDTVILHSKYTLYRALAAAEKTGLPHIRIHDLRHSHASLLIDLGFSPLAIADRLGHEKVQTTLEVYGHLYPSKQNEIVQKLQELK